MITKSLHFGKALSAALLVLLLAVGTTKAFAQTQVATLQHGDDVSVFYGTNAFVEANTAAQTGDIITLSSGTFVPATITKAITLRGAGCTIDTVAKTNPTIFGGTIYLNVADTESFLTIEGILFTNIVQYGSLTNPKFIRCNFTNINVLSSANMNNANFINCIIDKFNSIYAHNTVFLNSVIWDPSVISSSTSALLYNSIMRIKTFDGLSAYNSIIIKTTTYSAQSTCTFFSCIGINTTTATNPGVFGYGYASGCTVYTSYEDVFDSFNGTFSLDDASFVLKDEIATGFLGNDGTQVGIYGGFMPYNNHPSYMVVKRCNVANKSTVDGKLSVDIEVVTEE